MSQHRFKFLLTTRQTDTVTGFAGVVMSAVNYLTGCDRYSLQPTELKDGRPQDPYWIEEWRLGPTEHLEGFEVEFKYSNGDLVVDKVTGIEGVIVARIAHPHADVRYSVAPSGQKSLDDQQKWVTFDETQLTLKKADKVVLNQPAKSPGGPSRYDTPRR